LRRWCFATGLYSGILFLTLTLASCGGSSSTQNQQTPAANQTPTATPAGATVIDNVEDSTAWLTCGACGNNGATGSVAANSFIPGVASPSEDGGSTQFSIAASVPFTNTYWYQEHTPIAHQLDFLRYEFDLYIPNGSENAPQAIEFECQQKLDGWIYNFSWQALYPGSMWRIFNYGAVQWDATPLAFQHFTPGTWHHIAAEYHNDVTTHSVWHDALTIDGVRYPVNIRHDAFFSGATNNEFTNAVQLDTNSVPTPYGVYVDQMKITYK
jgi:hypothetical protein